MFRTIISGVGFAALVAGASAAAPSAAPAPAWVVSPADAACRAELELVGRSGARTPVTLVSDGDIVSMKFAKPDLPERAFLPIRIDRTRYSNLMLRTSEPGVGELVLSEETIAAMRKGATLDVAWLSEEPMSASLSGSVQGLSDLKTCGAQVAAQARARAQAEREAADRAAEEARAKALAEAQMQAARAQAAAAEAERQRMAAEVERRRLAQAAEAAEQERERQRQYAEAERRRAYEEAERRRAWEDEEAGPRWAPPPPQPRYAPPTPWAYRRW